MVNYIFETKRIKLYLSKTFKEVDEINPTINLSNTP